MLTDRVTLPGTLRLAAPEAQMLGTPDPNAIISVTLMLKRKEPLPSNPAVRVSREEFVNRYGADPAGLPMIQKFAEANDLTLGEINFGRRSLILFGTIANMNEAFGTELRLLQTSAGVYRGRVGTLSVPGSIADLITGVFGLDERPQARTRFRRNLAGPGQKAAGDNAYTPNAVAKLYQFPANRGAGQTIAMIELGGGFRIADLTTYFQTKLGFQNMPGITAVSVDGGQNQPSGDPNSADGEVLLDIEVAGAIAPEASIAVYFAPNTDQGFLDAITTAVHDSLRKPQVISISWGSPESNWTEQALSNFDQAFQDAVALGVTVCCASGDNGSSDGVTDGAAHVDFPASSPNVLACGGTRLESANGAATAEVVWNRAGGATGGGVSDHFPLPDYQAQANVPPSVNKGGFTGRGVPDVAGDADPATGYRIYVDGRDGVFGGTSAVAPLWSALVALLNEQNGEALGFVNPALYGAAGLFTDITSGNNGAFAAKPGWDACTGLGSPLGYALLEALAPQGGASPLLEPWE